MEGIKKWSRPVSRVLSWTIIHLGSASPQTSSNLPESDAGRANGFLFGLAPSGVYRTGLLPDSWCALTAPFQPYHACLRTVRRFTLCCTSRRLTPPRHYLALCPMEPGLSSTLNREVLGSDCLANSASKIKVRRKK